MSIPKREDPMKLFQEWFAEAQKCNLEEPSSFTLATVDGSGTPSARVVLLKGADQGGFVFYTNLESPKSLELLANPQTALCFYWMPLGKQVRVQGRAERVSDDEADAYFATRSRDSQIGAWASLQSQALTGWFELEKRVAEYALKFGLGKVPRPPHWSGFRVVPHTIEFWKSGLFRLHRRLLYTRTDSGWETRELYP